MDYQSQTLRQFDQETLGYQTRFMTPIDQMVSSQPGTIPKLTRSITRVRFWAATVFVYQYSDYCYAHLMRGTSGEETREAKEA